MLKRIDRLQIAVPDRAAVAEKWIALLGAEPNGEDKIAALGESGTLDFSALVDKTRHFSEINEGFAEMREGKLTRVVLTF